MPIHRIRLKAPWLVSAYQKGLPIELQPGASNPKRELPKLLEQLLGSCTEPVDIQAIRRFHRPTGLTTSSVISVEVSSEHLPDRVLFGPIDPGEESSDQLRELEALPSSENRIEFVLPQDLQLRSELRLQWNQLPTQSALESLAVELLIREPEDE
ncbi:MAG: hypothetical protein ACKO9H_08465 [Planctomycetota bacterium]